MIYKPLFSYAVFIVGIALFIVWFPAICNRKTREYLTKKNTFLNGCIVVLSFIWILGGVQSALDVALWSIKEMFFLHGLFKTFSFLAGILVATLAVKALKDMQSKIRTYRVRDIIED